VAGFKTIFYTNFSTLLWKTHNELYKKSILVISLGGSVIVPDEVDTIFLKNFRRVIFDYTKRGGRVVIVAGGGGINRKYNQATQKIARASNEDLDWIGIAATKLNAELLRVIFGKRAYDKVAVDPTQKVKTKKKIIIASGWLPGCSTDKDSVLWAKNLRAKIVVNLFDVDYV
jgi:uridylate kinase